MVRRCVLAGRERALCVRSMNEMRSYLLFTPPSIDLFSLSHIPPPPLRPPSIHRLFYARHVHRLQAPYPHRPAHQHAVVIARVHKRVEEHAGAADGALGVLLLGGPDAGSPARAAETVGV